MEAIEYPIKSDFSIWTFLLLLFSYHDNEEAQAWFSDLMRLEFLWMATSPLLYVLTRE